MRLKSGEGLFIQPGRWHVETTKEPVSFYIMAFTFDAHLQRVFQKILANDTNPIFNWSGSKISGILEELLELSSEEQTLTHQVIDALLQKLFWEILSCFPQDQLDSEFLSLLKRDTFLEKLQSLFNQNLQGDLSVKKMADAFNQSESSFAHKCKSLLGVSPRKSFAEQKLQRAREFLEETEMNVKEVAAYMGFRDPFVFSKAFKRQFGVSPDQWRKQN